MKKKIIDLKEKKIENFKNQSQDFFVNYTYQFKDFIEAKTRLSFFIHELNEENLNFLETLDEDKLVILISAEYITKFNKVVLLNESGLANNFEEIDKTSEEFINHVLDNLKDWYPKAIEKYHI